MVKNLSPQTISADSTEKSKPLSRQQQEKYDKELDAKIEKDIKVKSMPQYFRAGKHDKKDLNKQAKKSGILVIAVGAVVMLVMVTLVTLYLYNPGTLAKLPIFKSLLANQLAVSENTQALPVEKNVDSNTDKTPVNGNETVDNTNIDSSKTVVDANGNTAFPGAEDLASSTEDNSASSTEISFEDDKKEEPILEMSVQDTDGDGLSDIEEIVLGSNINDVDSDGDGFNDFTELQNFYNPAGNGMLGDSTYIQKKTNSSFNYTAYYPKSWTFRSLGGGYSVTFKASEDSFFQIIAEPNVEGDTISSWYSKKFPDRAITPQQKIIRPSWQGISSPDGLIVYLTDNTFKNIYIISYVPSVEGLLNFSNLFDMLVSHFEIGNL
jgi:hypothetical protein